MSYSEFTNLLIKQTSDQLGSAAFTDKFDRYDPVTIAARETSVIRLFSSVFSGVYDTLRVEQSDEMRRVPIVLWNIHNRDRLVSYRWVQTRLVAAARRNGMTLDEACDRIGNGSGEWPKSAEAVEKAYKRSQSSANPHHRYDYFLDEGSLTVLPFDMFSESPRKFSK